MVIDTMFADQIVNASELRSNQKKWLEKAVDKPITVNYGRKQLAIVNREQMRKLYMENHYLVLALRICQELSKPTKKGSKSNVFPWIDYLNETEKFSFKEELANSLLKSIMVDELDESDLENMIADWKATAEVKANPEAVKALSESKNHTDYVRIK